MNRLARHICMVAGIGGVIWFAGALRVAAAEDNPPAGGDERVQRLERRLNEVAERQEQMMRRFGAPMQQEQMQGRRGPIRGEGPVPPFEPGGFHGPMPAAGPHPGLPGPGAGQALHDLGGMVRLMFLVWILCNILLAVWIFTDIRRRGEGSGIFIVLALMAGIPAAIIYSLVRISDRMAGTTTAVGKV